MPRLPRLFGKGEKESELPRPQWYTNVPYWFFAVGNFLYLEEAIGLLTFGVSTAVLWILVATLPWFLPIYASVAMAVIGVLVFIFSIRPRVRDNLPGTGPAKFLPTIVKERGRAPPEILRSELSVDSRGHFRDPQGRRVYLRGVNLSGDSKLPVGSTSLDEPKLGSFVGRPFPLEDADEHLSRLRSAGFTLLRLVITWEAVEPRKHGEYDREYLAYLRDVVRACRRYGISVVIDPHQDVWSRWTGGDGAPKWTLDKLGFEVANFWDCKGAVLHNKFPGMPTVMWSTNVALYSTATMFTLFFAGNDFVKNRVDGERVQDWLQNAYINAIVEVAKILKDEPNVLGFEATNEPSAGWVGGSLKAYAFGFPLGWILSPWDAIRCANGESLRVPVFEKPMVFSRWEDVNPKGKRVWKEGVRDIWAENGLWDDTEWRVLRNDFFAIPHPSKREAFQRRYMLPFWRKFGDAIHAVIPDAFIFTSPTLEFNAPGEHQPAETLFPGRQVWSPHWYDGLTVLNKRFRSWLGIDERGLVVGSGAQAARVRGVQGMMSRAERMPTMIGESGVPWMGAEMTQRAMAATLDAMDFAQPDALTLWTYACGHAGSTDGWNNEDFSIWTKGGWRVPEAVRPHVKRLAAGAARLKVRCRRLREGASLGGLQLEFLGGVPGSVCEVFVPLMHFPQGVRWVVSEGDTAHFNRRQQTLFVTIGPARSGLPKPSKRVHKVDVFSAPLVQRPLRLEAGRDQ